MFKSCPSATLSIITLFMPHSSQIASLNICPCWSGSLLTMLSWPGRSPGLISFYTNSTNPSSPFQNAPLPKASIYFLPILPLCREFFSVTFIKSSHLCICLLLLNCKCHWPSYLSQCLEHSPVQIHAQGIYWASKVRWFQFICSELIWTLPGDRVMATSKIAPHSILKLWKFCLFVCLFQPGKSVFLFLTDSQFGPIEFLFHVPLLAHLQTCI